MAVGDTRSKVYHHTIILTFIRHVESTANATDIIDTSTPGPDITGLGEGQAAAVANELSANRYDGIYASTMVRSQETATPLAQTLGEPVTVLARRRRPGAGVGDGAHERSAAPTAAADAESELAARRPVRRGAARGAHRAAPIAVSDTAVGRSRSSGDPDRLDGHSGRPALRDDPRSVPRIQRDDWIMWALTDPERATRVVMDASDFYVRQLLVRAAAVGERIAIYSNQPQQWLPLSQPNIAVVERRRALEFVPSIIVNDRPTTPPSVGLSSAGLSSTVITLGRADHGPAPDIRFMQISSSTVRITSGGATRGGHRGVSAGAGVDGVRCGW